MCYLYWKDDSYVTRFKVIITMLSGMFRAMTCLECTSWLILSISNGVRLFFLEILLRWIIWSIRNTFLLVLLKLLVKWKIFFYQESCPSSYGQNPSRLNIGSIRNDVPTEHNNPLQVAHVLLVVRACTACVHIFPM